MFREFAKYSGFVSNSLKQVFVYRFGAVVWMVFPLFFLLVQYFLWSGIFESNGGTLYGYQLPQYLAYIGMGYITVRLTACGREGAISSELKNGEVAMSLVKPFSYHMMNFAQHLGNRLAFAIQSIPMFVVIVILAQIGWRSTETLGLYLFSILLAFIINFQFSIFLGTIAFYITNVWGLFLLRGSLRMIFSGETIAIGLYFRIAEQSSEIRNLPVGFLNAEGVKSVFGVIGIVSYLLPFQAMYYTPSAIYSGLIDGAQSIAFHLAVQIGWIVFFAIVNKILWQRALKKISIFGG